MVVILSKTVNDICKYLYFKRIDDIRNPIYLFVKLNKLNMYRS